MVRLVYLTLREWKVSDVIRAHPHKQAGNPEFWYVSTSNILYTPEDDVLFGRVRDIEPITDKQMNPTSRIAISAPPEAASEDYKQETKHILHTGAQAISADATSKYACSALHTEIYLGRLFVG